MPEGSSSTISLAPMGEESPQPCPPLPVRDHEQESRAFSGSYSRLCSEPSEGQSERPVSLVSTLSSGSSRGSHGLYDSTGPLLSSSLPPPASQNNVSLELSPPEGAREPPSPRAEWQERCPTRTQTNNKVANRKAAAPQNPPSLLVTEIMAPNPKLTYVDRVVMEIIETERTYVRDLRSIVEDYLAHIIDVGTLPIRPEQVCALFGNIQDIYELNSELLQYLDMCENDPVAVARCFVDKSEYFDIYTQYCTNYPNSVAALTDCMRSKTLAKFFRDRQASLKLSLPLGSYLLKPVQRILKYHLLLQEIAKHYDPEEDGCEVVQEAIDTMTGVAWYINDMKRKHEHAVRLQEIQSLLINWKGPDLTTYGELVLEGSFHVHRAKNTRTLFLFHKMLLITKKRGEHYVYKNHISCSTLMLLDSAKDPLLFSVIHFKYPKQPHTVQAKTVEEKRIWAHHIKRLILENHHTIVPQKAKEAILEMDSISPWKSRYSPEGLKKAVSCPPQELPAGARPGRRRSAILKHSDSAGVLLGARRSLQPTAAVTALGSSPGEAEDERPSGKEDTKEPGLEGGDSEDRSPPGRDPRAGNLPCEWGLEQEKEDVLLEDDQEEEGRQGAEEETSVLGEQGGQAGAEEVRAEQVSDEAPPLHCLAQQAEPGGQGSKVTSQYSTPAASPPLPLRQPEAEPPESQEASRKDEEEESDSSGLQLDTSNSSTVTNGELSEEEGAGTGRVRPSCVDQASAARCPSSPSSSSLASGDLVSPACPSPPLGSSSTTSLSTDLHEKSGPDSSTTPAPGRSPVSPPEVERRSTLSKQDRLLIHKIRRYYEHAEHEDASFSIKRRESLSYIPRGLVRHLSSQLDSPQDALPPQRNTSTYSRPTSWSVFDLPGLEGHGMRDSQNISRAAPGVEEFWPASEMVHVWQDMELEEKGTEDGEGRQTEETLSPPCLHRLQRNNQEEPLRILEESDGGSVSEEASSPSITPSPAREDSPVLDPCPGRPPWTRERVRLARAPLPRIISLRSGVEEDMILQDMEKMKNKVFQLARQYSQRIKNNRPVVRQRNREVESMGTSKNLAAVHEEKDQNRDGGKPKLMLSLTSYDQVIIQELPSPSPSQSLSSGASSRVTSPCPPLTTSPQPPAQAFHWPDISELRSLYTPTSRLGPGAGPPPSPVTRSCLAPEDALGSCSGGVMSSWGSTESCSMDPLRGTSDCPGTRLNVACEGGSPVGGQQPQDQPQLCRWSSVDHKPLHEMQNLPDPMRSCYVAGHLTLPNEPKVIIVERVPGGRAGDGGMQGGEDGGMQEGEDGGCQDKEELVEVEGLHRAALDCTKTSMLTSGRKTQNRLVKNLRERFQSLNS
ncbi:pleckstrin homology domain-containing family G member 3 isoform X2 [Osmerus mordax]|uniref:pleckstrin homology domain-containing family G member 3 isoform X2 n=1 Tax=Osmerus mordax TaxID=8014 RepID=UPI00350EB4AD